MFAKLPVKKCVFLIILLGVFGLYFFVDFEQYITLTQLIEWQEKNPLIAASMFLTAYFLVAAFSLPGTGPLTFAAGAIFGLLQGVVLVSLVTATGATVGMLLSRTLLRAWVERKYRHVVQRVNEGIARDGNLYLFSLRLIPPMPYFLVNLAFGLTRMPARTFYLVSQIGMLPIVIVYVNAGANLREIEAMSWSGIFTPQVLFAISALILLPFLMKFCLRFYGSKIKNRHKDAFVKNKM